MLVPALQAAASALSVDPGIDLHGECKPPDRLPLTRSHGARSSSGDGRIRATPGSTYQRELG